MEAPLNVQIKDNEDFIFFLDQSLSLFATLESRMKGAGSSEHVLGIVKSVTTMFKHDRFTVAQELAVLEMRRKANLLTKA